MGAPHPHRSRCRRRRRRGDHRGGWSNMDMSAAREPGAAVGAVIGGLAGAVVGALVPAHKTIYSFGSH